MNYSLIKHRSCEYLSLLLQAFCELYLSDDSAALKSILSYVAVLQFLFGSIIELDVFHRLTIHCESKLNRKSKSLM